MMENKKCSKPPTRTYFGATHRELSPTLLDDFLSVSEVFPNSWSKFSNACGPYVIFRYSHTLYVWNIYQHLPEQNHPHVGRYTIHGAYGIFRYCLFFVHGTCSSILAEAHGFHHRCSPCIHMPFTSMCIPNLCNPKNHFLDTTIYFYVYIYIYLNLTLVHKNVYQFFFLPDFKKCARLRVWKKKCPKFRGSP